MLRIFFKYFHYFRVKLGLNRKKKLYNLIKRHKPESILEIGVDEGKNAINMISIMNKYIPQSKNTLHRSRSIFKYDECRDCKA